jgi:glycyl-tRNA synthetase beta chain
MKVLFEIGVEEIPADYLAPAAANIKENSEKLLTEKRLKFSSLNVAYTVRRFVVVIEGMAAAQDDLSFEKKGPKYDVAYKDGKLTDVGRNFLEKSGIIEKDVKVKEDGGKKFLYIDIFEKGRTSSEVLGEIFPAVINAVRFPKSMIWDASQVTFARPVRWLLALADSEIIPFRWGLLSSGNKTRLHKFDDTNAEMTVKTPDDYMKIMAANGIILSQEERAREITEKTAALLGPKGMKVLEDKVLLDRLAESVEKVTVVGGPFDEKFLFLPKEVIITAMREHQRYFAVLKNSGEFTNYFVNVRDGGKENNEFIAKQLARVLYARLKDAEFFFKEDLKKPIEANLPKLKEAIFITGLGNMYNKVERLKALAEMSGELFGYNDPVLLAETAWLSKADLVTDMISEKEYVGLRGFMGGVYYEKQGKSKKICTAVAEQYYPNFTGDRLPSTDEGLYLSLIDKMDNICGFYLAGFKPTGSKDPYAVRRQALTTIYIMIEKQLDIDLKAFVRASAGIYFKQLGKSFDEQELLTFFRQREINYLKDKGVDYDIINSVTKGDEYRLLDDYKKAFVIMEARKLAGFNDAIFALSRVNNIIPDGFSVSAVDPKLFSGAEETALYGKFMAESGNIAGLVRDKKFAAAFSLISGFKPEIDAFFEKILVMDKDETLKANRLSMLSEIGAVFLLFADFREIVIDRK